MSKSPAALIGLEIVRQNQRSGHEPAPTGSSPASSPPKRQRRVIQLFLLVALVIALGTWVRSLAAFGATTFTVDSVGDEPDADPLDGICADAAGQCTLRAAIEDLNAQGPGTVPHQIHFDISGSGPFTITPAAPLPDITVPVVINGTTQDGASCPTSSAPANLLIVLDGRDLGANEDGLALGPGSEGSIVWGLVIGNFDGDGILIDSNDNRVRCNHIGVQADGVTSMGNGTTGIFVSSDGNEIGGANSHAGRNVISANSRPIQLYGESNLVVNNFIGTTADGMTALGNSSGMIIAQDGNTIGGSGPRERNIISGSDGYAIYISQTDNNHILGNLIGVARDAITPIPNGGEGIELYGAALNNVIGGINPGEGNVIAYSDGHGIELIANDPLIPANNAIRGNNIHNNVELGIVLGGDSNLGQNHPFISSTPDSYLVDATLDSLPNATFDVDVFRNDSCDPSGFGEGQQYLDSLQVTTDGGGYVAFQIDLSGLAGDGNVITVTATDPAGNSSEFSNCATLSVPPTPPDHAVYIPVVLR